MSLTGNFNHFSLSCVIFGESGITFDPLLGAFSSCGDSSFASKSYFHIREFEFCCELFAGGSNSVHFSVTSTTVKAVADRKLVGLA